MKKIEIVGLLCDSKRIIERLQRRGIVELCSTQDDQLTETNTGAVLSQFERSRASVEQALSIVESFCPEKTPLLDSLAPEKQTYGVDEFGKKASELEKVMQTVYDVITQQKQIADCKAEIGRLCVLHDNLDNWRSLDLPLNFQGTESTRCYIGSIPGQWTAEQISEIVGDRAETEIISSYKEQTNLTVMCLRNERKPIHQALREIGYTSLTDVTDRTPVEQMTIYENAIADQQKKIAQCEEKIRSSKDNKADFKFFIDYLTMRRDKYVALNNLSTTEKTFIITGYIPEKYAPALVKELENKYTVAIQLLTPQETEDVPVKLENDGFSSPVEGITEMYALPGKRDVDPSPIMAFFYYFFFGLMLSDAGYGLLMVFLTAFTLKKMHFGEKMRKTLKMFFFCGISTVFWGALFGSWFGDAIPVIAEQFFGKTVTIPCWFEPIEDPIRLLLYSFAFGIVHLFVGIGVNFHISWKAGKKFDAIFDNIPVYMTVLGVCPFGANIFISVNAALIQYGLYLALAGVVLIVLTAGRSSKSIPMRFLGELYALYNTATGYLGDILSYSRLLALGLATGSIAGVINLCATMPENPVFKLILFLVVFPIGHTLNILINLLGAYVHTSRLQFVELFSKFYEGGGRSFQPLQTNTKYIQFTEETNHE